MIDNATIIDNANIIGNANQQRVAVTQQFETRELHGRILTVLARAAVPRELCGRILRFSATPAVWCVSSKESEVATQFVKQQRGN